MTITERRMAAGAGAIAKILQSKPQAQGGKPNKHKVGNQTGKEGLLKPQSPAPATHPPQRPFPLQCK